MAEHTPGPWRISESGSGYVEPGVDILSDCPWTVAVALTDCKHHEANARLIAAAPDMLECLQEVAEWLRQGSLSEYDAPFKKIHQVIAQAVAA